MDQVHASTVITDADCVTAPVIVTVYLVKTGIYYSERPALKIVLKVIGVTLQIEIIHVLLVIQVANHA
jgi:hypothetical protein